MSKECLLDFLVAAEIGAQRPLIRDENSELRVATSVARKAWLESEFSAEDMNAANISACAETAFSKLASNLNAEDSEFGRALEVITAHIAQKKIFKPPIKLGRYTFKGGHPKPDCVEVVVREIVESLIFGSYTHFFLV